MGAYRSRRVGGRRPKTRFLPIFSQAVRLGLERAWGHFEVKGCNSGRAAGLLPPMRLPSRLCPMAAVFAAGISPLVAPAAPDFPTPALLQPAVAAFARAHAYPISGIQELTGDSAGQPGDALTFLVTLGKSHRTEQWLVQLRIVEPTARERASIRHSKLTLSSSEGQRFEFDTDANTALEVRTAGPFAGGPAPPGEERRARAMVSQDFLRLGLDRSCAALLRRDAARKNVPKGVGTAPRLSDDEVRALVGIFPALFMFVQEIQSTPGVEDILWSIMDKPSIWSVVRHGGKVQIGINVEEPTAIDPATWESPDPPSYRLPVMISVYDQPALRCFLFVTSPRPPLVASAGIVGIVAVPPSRPADRLEIRLIAAHTR